MPPPQEIETVRLHLTPPALKDAENLIRFANDPYVYAMTLSMPFPYTGGAAIDFLAKVRSGWKDGTAQMFAIRPEDTGEFIGGIGLHHNARYGSAEVGYWIGEPHRGKGYTTEALRALVDYAFSNFPLVRITGMIKEDNAASGKVLTNAGFKWEARMEDHTVKGEDIQTVMQYRILRRELKQFV